MLERKSLIVTPPPTREERAALRAHAAGETTAADLLVTQTRITVSALNTLQYGRYEVNRRAVGAWLTERSGLTWAAAIEDADGLALIEAGLRWARVRAALVAVETRTANRVSDEVATDWAAAVLPELDAPGAFADELPGDLAAALDELVFDLNPGLFRYADQDAAEAKKNGGISAA